MSHRQRDDYKVEAITEACSSQLTDSTARGHDQDSKLVPTQVKSTRRIRKIMSLIFEATFDEVYSETKQASCCRLKILPLPKLFQHTVTTLPSVELSSGCRPQLPSVKLASVVAEINGCS